MLIFQLLDLERRLFYEKVLFFTQLTSHLMNSLLNNVYILKSISLLIFNDAFEIASRQAWLKKELCRSHIRIPSICKTFQELLVPIPLATVRTVPPTSLCKPFPTKPILHWAFEILYLPRNGVVIDDLQNPLHNLLYFLFRLWYYLKPNNEIWLMDQVDYGAVHKLCRLGRGVAPKTIY